MFCKKVSGERFIFLARSRQTAQRLGSENSFPVGAVFRSAKNHCNDESGFRERRAWQRLHAVQEQALLVASVEREGSNQAGLGDGARYLRVTYSARTLARRTSLIPCWLKISRARADAAPRCSALAGSREAARKSPVTLWVASTRTWPRIFERTSVGQIRSGGASIWLAHLALSDRSPAEKQGIFSAGLQGLCREILRRYGVSEATGLYGRQNGVFSGSDRFDKELSAGVFLDSKPDSTLGWIVVHG
jgi:hypothetical protein